MLPPPGDVEPASDGYDARCPECAYDRAAPGGGFLAVCPECGSSDADRRLRPWPSRRRVLFVLVAPALVDAALFLLAVLFQSTPFLVFGLFLVLIAFMWPIGAATHLADAHAPRVHNNRVFLGLLLLGWAVEVLIGTALIAGVVVYASLF